jgi:hypothetical protein
MFPHLRDENCKTDLTFLVDIIEHLTSLNVILQVKDLLLQELHREEQAFRTKLLLFSEQIKENKCTRFHPYEL